MNNKEQIEQKKYLYKFIIIDFTLVHFIDEYGVKCLQKIKTDYNNDDVKIFLTNCNGKLKAFAIKLNQLSK